MNPKFGSDLVAIALKKQKVEVVFTSAGCLPSVSIRH